MSRRSEQPDVTPAKAVAVYARVSSDAQATKGTIGSQLEALRSHMATIGA